MVHHIFRLHGIWTLSPTGDPSSHRRSGSPSAKPSAPRSACHLVTTLRPTDRPSGRIRTWGRLLGVWRTVTLRHGVLTSRGSNTPITPSSALPLGCPPSCAPWGSSLHCSQLWKERWQSRHFRPICGGVDGSGGRPGLPSSLPLPEINALQTATGLQLPSTSLARRCGYPPGTSPSKPPPRSSTPGLWDPIPSRPS